MSGVQVVRLLHVLSVAFFGGGLVVLLYTQSRLGQLSGEGKRVLADSVFGAARRLVVPLMLVGFVAGLVLMFWLYGSFGMGKVMSCTPVYVHIMFMFGIFALGFSQVWKAKVRKLSQAVAAGEAAESHLRMAGVFAWLALVATVAAFVVGTWRVPNPPRTRCVPPQAAVLPTAPAASFVG